MKILLIANYLPDRQQSMLHIARMLDEGLKKAGHKTRLMRPEPFFCRIQQPTNGLGKWLGYLDKMVVFPYRLKKEAQWADIVHICDHSNAIYTKYLKNKPHVITCCDLLAIRSALGEFKENPTRWTGKILQKMILKGLNRAQHIVCISHATKKDLLRLSKLKDEDVSVVYLSLNYNYSPVEKSDTRNYLMSLSIDIDRPFMLHVGKNNWYKNRKGLLTIFKHIINTKGFQDYKLVLAGEALSKELHILIDELKIKNSIAEIISPKDEDLKMLYSSAVALIYPSIAEGFGWPIVEAQACGCPVFTTYRPPMIEAGGKAAVYFELDDHKEAACIVIETLKDSKKIEVMRQKGFENVKKFDSAKMIDEYIKIYQKAIKQLN